MNDATSNAISPRAIVIKMNPLSITQAIAELGEPKLDAAITYARTCIDLLASGIPRKDLAAALEPDDGDLIQTQALTTLTAWGQDPQGLLVLCGPYGVGKSFAGHRLALARYRAGLRTRWMPLAEWPSHNIDAQGTWIEKADAAPLLVLDDVGAGLTAPRTDKPGGSYGGHLREVIEARLLNAIADGRPVVMISNGAREELAAYLKGRNVDRMAEAGGIVEIPEGTPSLRKPGRVRFDAAGRWRRWSAAAELIALAGGDDAGRWSRFLRRAQELDNSRDPNARAELKALHRRMSDMLELDRDEVLARADDVERRTADMLRDASRVFGVEVEEPTFDAVAGAIARRRGAQRQEQEWTGPRACAPDPSLPPLDAPAARAARERLAPMGFGVKLTNLYGWQLLFDGRPLSIHWPSAEQAWLAGLEHVPATVTA